MKCHVVFSLICYLFQNFNFHFLEAVSFTVLDSQAVLKSSQEAEPISRDFN